MINSVSFGAMPVKDALNLNNKSDRVYTDSHSVQEGADSVYFYKDNNTDRTKNEGGTGANRKKKSDWKLAGYSTLVLLGGAVIVNSFFRKKQ